MPFSPSLRWSAVRTAEATWVLGAPEALAPFLTGPDLGAEVQAGTSQGLRVLVFASSTDPEDSLRDASGQPTLPALEPLALV